MSERCERASERANGRASGPVLQSVFLAVIDHSADQINVGKNQLPTFLGQFVPGEKVENGMGGKGKKKQILGS